MKDKISKVLLFLGVVAILCGVGCVLSDAIVNTAYPQKGAKLEEITFNGETHEYVYWETGYQGSLSHWAGCKYCKNHKK